MHFLKNWSSFHARILARLPLQRNRNFRSDTTIVFGEKAGGACLYRVFLLPVCTSCSYRNERAI